MFEGKTVNVSTYNYLDSQVSLRGNVMADILSRAENHIQGTFGFEVQTPDFYFDIFRVSESGDINFGDNGMALDDTGTMQTETFFCDVIIPQLTNELANMLLNMKYSRIQSGNHTLPGQGLLWK